MSVRIRGPSFNVNRQNSIGPDQSRRNPRTSVSLTDEKKNSETEENNNNKDPQASSSNENEPTSSTTTLSSPPPYNTFSETRNYNTPHEIYCMSRDRSVMKMRLRNGNCFVRALLAGYAMTIGGILAIATAGGLDAQYSASYPATKEIMAGICCQIALQLIVFAGTELFTGNLYYHAIGLLSRAVPVKGVAKNMAIVFAGNIIGIVSSAYLIGYQSNIFANDPQLSYIKATAIKKCTLTIAELFLRAIPANCMICYSIMQCLAARTVGGKIAAMILPMMAFASVGFNHCLADVFYISLGWMYGADVTIGQLLINLVFTVLGNIVGGSFIVATGLWFTHGE